MAHRGEATANSFATKIQGEVFAHFHAAIINLHSSVHNLVLCLPA
jgi:hypothetical protein